MPSQRPLTRRMTICRSERAALLALVAVPLVCWSLRAQDTTRAVRDTTQATPAPQPLTQIPATHTVGRGETLWSIAQLYFNDPLLWPEIYRLNTALIEDPHWIYPGEVLNLAGAAAQPVVAAAPAETTAAVAPADTVRAQPTPAESLAAALPVDTTLRDTTQAVVEEPPPPPAEEAYQTIFDRPSSRTSDVRAVLRAYMNQPYRPVRRGEFYGAGFLTEGEHLPWGQVVSTAERSSIPRLTEMQTAIQYKDIIIEPPSAASYHVGDSLLVVRLDRHVGDWGQVVLAVAIVRVKEVTKKQLLAEVVTQYDRVGTGQLALPLEPFKDPGEVRPTPVNHGLLGQVIDQRDPHAVALSQQVVFLNRGRADGVVPGDVFQIYTGEPGTPSEDVRAVVEVVHTRERSSSAIILQVQNAQLLPGLPTRLVRKMPS